MNEQQMPSTVKLVLPPQPRQTSKVLRLSPRSPIRSKPVDTIGYFGGDLPSIIVHLSGRKYEVLLGQCIPTSGREMMIENPYGRTADVQVVYNAPPSLLPATIYDKDSRQSRFVTYYGSFNLPADGVHASGVGLLLKEGRALVNIKTKALTDVYVLPQADLTFLDTKPAGYMPELVDFKHASGATMGDLTCVNGVAEAAQVFAWAAAAGYDLIDRHFIMQQANSETLFLEAGTALFIVGNKAATFKANITVVDHGIVDGPSNV